MGSRSSGQTPGPIWLADDVADVALGQPNCIRYPRVNGFGFAPDGTAMVGWTQVEGCGGNNETYWSEKLAEGWLKRQWGNQGFWGTATQNGAAHEFAVGADGRPYLFMVGGNSSSLTYHTYRADLRAHAEGQPGYLVWTGEHVGNHQECVYVNYRLAAGPGQDWPYRVTRRGRCDDSGPFRFEGQALTPELLVRGFDLAMGADGRAHIAYLSGGHVMYMRPGEAPVQVATVNYYSDDVAIQPGANGTVHIVARGLGFVNELDRGLLAYFRSDDDGATWTHVDNADASRVTYGLSLQLDPSGAPAVAYWRYGQGLYYASRASGAWVESRVVNPGWSGTEWVKPPHLRFDTTGVPHIAYYDWSANRIRISSPWAGAPADAPPVDLRVAGNASPNPTVAGTQVTYTLTVTNASAREASGVRLHATLPPGTTADTINPAPLTNSGGVLTFNTWRIAGGGTGQDRLPAGATGTITFNVSGLATGISELPLVATSTEADANLADNSTAIAARINEATCALPVTGRLAWWPADGTPLNYGTWSFYGGAPVGGVTYGPGAVGQAFHLDGTTGYVPVNNGYPEQFWPGTAPLSVAAWFSTSVASPDVQAIASMDDMANAPCCGSPQGHAAWYLFVADGVVKAALRQNTYGSASIGIIGTTPVADGAFHHAALVIDVPALQARLYVDGALEGSAPLPGGWTMSNGDFEAEQLVIGGAQRYWAVGYHYFFNGAIDDVSLYKRVLTAAEIANAASGPSRVECGALPVNQPPVVVAPLPDVTLLEDAFPFVVDLNGVFDDPDGADGLTYHASSDNQAVLTVALDGAARTLTLTPAPDAFGAAAVTVDVSDGARTATQTFLVTIAPVNDPPRVDQPADVRVGAGTEVVVPLTGLAAGAPNEFGQILAVTATSSSDAVTGAVSATLGDIRFTPPARTDVGVAAVKVEVADNGGTADGGLDRTVRTFTVTVVPPPSIAAPEAQSDVTGAAVSLPLSFSTYPGAPLHFTATGLPPGLSIDAGTGVIGGTLGTETGAYTVTVTLDDGLSSTSISFAWQVVLAVVEITVDEQITVTDTVEARPAVMLTIDETIAVTDEVTPLPAAVIAIDEVITVTDGVETVAGNTPAGSNTVVVFGGGSSKSVVLTFANVTGPGQTTVQPADTAPPLPAAFVMAAPPLVYDIFTTAQFTGNVEVCVEYDPAAYKTSEQRLFHHNGTAWTDTTTSHRRDTSTVCGTTTHFSPFAVVEPEAPSLDGRIRCDGRLATDERDHEFHLHVSEGTRWRRPNDRLRYEVTTTETVTSPGKSAGKGKAAPAVVKRVKRTDRFEATAIQSRRFIAVDSVVVTGIGTWNGAAGYAFEARAEDRGEPGKGRDTFAVTIRSPQGEVVATVAGTITAGNIQSHRVGKR